MERKIQILFRLDHRETYYSTVLSRHKKVIQEHSLWCYALVKFLESKVFITYILQIC